MKTTRRGFVKTTAGGALTVGLLFDVLSRPLTESPNGNALPRKSPESQGSASKAILNFVNAANRSGSEWHSFLVDEGKLSVEDQVISFFPDKLPDNPSQHLKALFKISTCYYRKRCYMTYVCW